jgi:hypothetical protein
MSIVKEFLHIFRVLEKVSMSEHKHVVVMKLIHCCKGPEHGDVHFGPHLLYREPEPSDPNEICMQAWEVVLERPVSRVTVRRYQPGVEKDPTLVFVTVPIAPAAKLPSMKSCRSVLYCGS